MLHECNYCHEHKGIQAFHYSQEEAICSDCYEDFKQQADEYEIASAFILEERKVLKNKMQQLDNEELPF
jgi:recombinational DNA repair protein (RecF pathway)